MLFFSLAVVVDLMVVFGGWWMSWCWEFCFESRRSFLVCLDDSVVRSTFSLRVVFACSENPSKFMESVGKRKEIHRWDMCIWEEERRILALV